MRPQCHSIEIGASRGLRDHRERRAPLHGELDKEHRRRRGCHADGVGPAQGRGGHRAAHGVDHGGVVQPE
eukprot:3208679-Pyramimonas_sp.AAC.1